MRQPNAIDRLAVSMLSDEWRSWLTAFVSAGLQCDDLIYSVYTAYRRPY